MLVVIDKYPIDSRLFRNCCVNERLCLAYFIHRPGGMEGELTFTILFENQEDTRRFFKEYHTYMYEGQPVYEFTGKAWFSHELYVRIRDGINNNE